MTAILRNSARLFHPPQHLWLKVMTIDSLRGATGLSTTLPTQEPATTNTTAFDNAMSQESYWVEIGLTARGLEDIGDCTSLQSAFFEEHRRRNEARSNNSRKGIITDHGDDDDPTIRIQKGDELLTVEWDGHSITGADELYHTVWETFEGRTALKAPFSGTLQDLYNNNNPRYGLWIDEEMTLAQLTTTEQELLEACDNGELVHELEYERLVGAMPPGKFHEPEQVA